LRIQVLALTSSWCEVCEGPRHERENGGPAEFLASMASFCDVTFPPYLSLDGSLQLDGDNEDERADEAVVADLDHTKLKDVFDRCPPEKYRSLEPTVRTIVNALKETQAA
jgi:hypothetical protein